MSITSKPDKSSPAGQIFNESDPEDYSDEISDEYFARLVKSVESIKPKEWDYVGEPGW